MAEQTSSNAINTSWYHTVDNVFSEAVSSICVGVAIAVSLSNPEYMTDRSMNDLYRLSNSRCSSVAIGCYFNEWQGYIRLDAERSSRHTETCQEIAP